jgi:predicted XRE-type DNA-binding protein
MDYPDDFPQDLKDRVEVAISDAETAFTKNRGRSIPDADALLPLIGMYVLTILSAFADSACIARERGLFDGARFRREYETFLYSLVQRAINTKYPEPHSAVADIAKNAMIQTVKMQYESSESWLAIQNRLRDAAQKPETPRTIGQQISALIAESKLTQEEIAENVGIDPANVSRHASGKSRPSKKTKRGYEALFSKLLKRDVVIRVDATERN